MPYEVFSIDAEEDMRNLCSRIKGPFEVEIVDNTSHYTTDVCKELNKFFINEGIVGRDSHLQQGIESIYMDDKDNVIEVHETPYFYPSEKIIELSESLPCIVGPTTGVLVNCYDPFNELFLFQMRGGDIDRPFAFQAAAAGAGEFNLHPEYVARKELAEEAGLVRPKSLFPKKALDILPFIRAGNLPQILLSYGFSDTLRKYPRLSNMDEILSFEEDIKIKLEDGLVTPGEAYPFTLQQENVLGIVSELENEEKLYGPIGDSVRNFYNALKV